MLKNEREQEILAILRAAGYSTVKNLSRQLYTSESSIRRALAGLEASGLVRRSYGGAELLDRRTTVTAFSTRAHQNTEAKRLIAQKAAPLVRDGSIVFLDGSSTCFYLAAQLLSKTDLTVVTNSLMAAAELMEKNFHLIRQNWQSGET